MNCGAPHALFHADVLPQAARRSGHLPAVMHGLALRAMSLRDFKILHCNNYEFAFSFRL